MSCQHHICHVFVWLHHLSPNRIPWISKEVRSILKWCNTVNQMSGQNDSCKHQCLWFAHQTDSFELLHAGAEHQIRGYQNILHIFHNSYNKHSSFKWRQTSRLQWPPYKLCFTVLSTQCLCGLCKNNHLSIISKKLALWQTNYSSGFHPLAQEEADYTFIFVVGWPWLGTRYPPKPFYHSPLQLDRERKYNSSLVGWEKDRERSLTDCHPEQNRLNLQKN